jgi:hypothetical protein
MFLNCCDNLAKQTLEFIEKSVPTDKEGAEEILALVGYAWTLVHSFIKRVMDADILQLPYSLTTFIDQQIRGLSGYDNLRIAFESIPDVNYLQERHTRLRKFISFLSEFLAKNAPDNSFSFVGLPFSQNNRLVTNCLLWHEVGHLIAEESNIFGTNKITKIEPQIVLTTPPQLNESTTKTLKLLAAQTLVRWMEEIFSDLIAILLLGPAYTFSFMELLSITVSEGKYSYFSRTHPPDALRLREQRKLLEKEGWAEKLKILPDWMELERITDIPSAEYAPLKEEDKDLQVFLKQLIPTLCQNAILEEISQSAEILLEGRKKPYDLYKASSNIIQVCLEHGIVPSVEKEGEIPHPVAVINGAIIFLLSQSESDNLYNRVEALKRSSPKDRAFLEQRLEMWCLKAIEDWIHKM